MEENTFIAKGVKSPKQILRQKWVCLGHEVGFKLLSKRRNRWDARISSAAVLSKMGASKAKL